MRHDMFKRYLVVKSHSGHRSMESMETKAHRRKPNVQKNAPKCIPNGPINHNQDLVSHVQIEVKWEANVWNLTRNEWQ